MAGKIESRARPLRKWLEERMPKAGGKGRPLLVGLTGGIASGKSTVSEMLKDLGAPLIDFDVIARRVVEPGTPALAKIVDAFGRQILRDDGRLDRKKLSRIVFHDAEKRKMLESRTHPAMYEELLDQVEAIARREPHAIVQVAVPLLVEFHLEDDFDVVVLVHASPRKQVERLVARDGIGPEEAARILQAQLPIDEKKAFADFVVDNGQDLSHTRKQVESLWSELKRIQGSRLP